MEHRCPSLQHRLDHRDRRARSLGHQSHLDPMSLSGSMLTTSMGPSRQHPDLCIRHLGRPMIHFHSSRLVRLEVQTIQRRTMGYLPTTTSLKARLSRRTLQRKWLQVQRLRLRQRWHRLEQQQRRWLPDRYCFRML